MTRPTGNAPTEADVVVVGLGAAGGVAARALTAAGLSVVALEAGPFLRSEDFVADEIGACAYDNDLGPKFNQEIPIWIRDDGTRQFATASPIGRMVNAVGGSSVHFVGWSRRFQPENFRALSSTLDRYGPRALPEDCALVDWPVTYEELEPYYTNVEYEVGVSGIAAHVHGAVSNDTGNPFEGPRSCGYPLPPLRSFRFGEMFAKAARGRDCHPYPAPAAILSQDFDGRPACCYCGWCSGQGCPFGSKGSTLVTSVPRAVATGLLDVRANTQVSRVRMAADRAIGVECLAEDGTPSVVEARAVLLAAYLFENTRLLFLSRCAEHPDGVGNTHGQLGKNFICRQAVEVNGFYPGQDLRLVDGPAGQAMCIDDFNGDNFDHRDLGFIRGATIAVENELTPIRAAKTVPPRIPRWGREYKKFMLDNWTSISGLRAMPEALPYLGNELSMAWSTADETPARLPRLAVRYRMRDNEQRMRAFLADKMTALTRDMGAAEIWPADLGLNVLSGHDFGGARMGVDPQTSVVDPYGRVHSTSNLYVLGGATFPTAPGINPTLTIQALAWRTADKVASDLR